MIGVWLADEELGDREWGDDLIARREERQTCLHRAWKWGWN